MTDSARMVFRTLIAAGPLTRPLLGQRLAMSKPTMSAAVAELTTLGLVAPSGIIQGATGRKAIVYGMGPQAGHVAGIDIGSTQVRAVARSLDGRILAESEQDLSTPHQNFGSETADALRSVRRRLAASLRGRAGPLRAAAVAIPNIVSTAHPDLAHQGDLHALDVMLPASRGVRRIVENNVNCAALAEINGPAAQGRSSFAYLQVGVKIGLGIVQNGTLFRGFNGAAGEVSRLPFPWMAHGVAQRNGLETYLGSVAFMERVQAAWQGSDAPRSPKALFERASQGSMEAHRFVEAHAADVGRLVAAVVAVIDPGLVILGGGIGQNDALLDTVRRVTADLCWPTEVTTSARGPRGTMLGAAQVAATAALGDLLQEGERFEPGH